MPRRCSTGTLKSRPSSSPLHELAGGRESMIRLRGPAKQKKKGAALGQPPCYANSDRIDQLPAVIWPVVESNEYVPVPPTGLAVSWYAVALGLTTASVTDEL